MSYLGSALKGFQSIAYSGSTPVSWGNIFVNPASLTNTFGVIGPCGTFDQILDQALGPDPTPCDDQTGPLPGEGSNTSPGALVLAAVVISDLVVIVTGRHRRHRLDAASGSPNTAVGPNSGLGALSQLVAPLLQGAG